MNIRVVILSRFILVADGVFRKVRVCMVAQCWRLITLELGLRYYIFLRTWRELSFLCLSVSTGKTGNSTHCVLEAHQPALRLLQVWILLEKELSGTLLAASN
jgi:hypothetical protein